MESNKPDPELISSIVYSIDLKTKLLLRLRATPVGSYILFHPYALFTDNQSGKTKLYGLVETHYTHTIANQTHCVSIENLTELILTNKMFKPLNGWRRWIDASRYSSIMFASAFMPLPERAHYPFMLHNQLSPPDHQKTMTIES